MCRPGYVCGDSTVVDYTDEQNQQRISSSRKEGVRLPYNIVRAETGYQVTKLIIKKNAMRDFTLASQ